MDQLHQMNDDQLVKAYMEGLDEAFDILLARHQTRLYSYILYTVKNRDMADDVFQDTFAKAIFQLREGRYTANGRFYSWISCIAHNLIADIHRSEKNFTTISDEDCNAENYLCDTSAGYEGEQKLANERTLSNLRHLISCLPPEQQKIIEQRYFRNMSFRDITAEDGLNLNTALSRVSYAFNNIRRQAAREHLSMEWY